MLHILTAIVCFSMTVCVTGTLDPGATPEPRPATPAGQDPARLQESQEDKAAAQEIELPTGPMRVEPWAISETRTRYESDPPAKPAKQNLMLRAKLTGERLVDMVGRGDLIIEEMADDTGAVLKTIADYDARELTRTYPLKAGKRMLEAGHAGLTADAPVTTRAAHKLAKVRGYVNVAYATGVEEVVIDNPLQYLGGYLEHPRLKELDFKVKVIEPGEELQAPRDVSGLALQYEGGTQRHIYKAEFFDAWLKPMYARDRAMETADGQEYMFFAVSVGKIDPDTQMVLKFFPKVEEEKVPFEFTDLELP
jgi:hypothetical protein